MSRADEPVHQNRRPSLCPLPCMLCRETNVPGGSRGVCGRHQRAPAEAGRSQKPAAGPARSGRGAHRHQAQSCPRRHRHTPGGPPRSAGRRRDA